MQAVIFDMDGVIVDSEYHWKIQEDLLFSKILKNISKEKLDQIIGINVNDIYEMFKDDLDGDVTREEFLNEFDKLAMEIYSKKVKMHEGFMELINSIHNKNIPIALVSSSPKPWVDIVIDRFSIRKYFNLIVTAEDVNLKAKPAPDIYLLAAKKLGISPRDCVAIEDSKNGVVSAKDAGMSCIGYDGGSHDNQDLSRADMIVKDFKDIDIGELCKQ